MPVRLVGLRQAEAKVNAAIKNAGREVMAELTEFCFAVCGEAARRAPVETGDLRGSFVVEINGERWGHTTSGADGSVSFVRDRSDVPADVNTIQIYVGTAGCVYAVRQHEELTWNHPRGGQAKFLETTLNEFLPTLEERLREAARRGARGGV